jgi:hypothetical protein
VSGVVVALLLGLRHGVDPDHIAAISDIASVRKSIGRTLREALGYAIGHGVVVLAFVSIVMLVGASVPSWFGQVSSVLVGATLIGLGFWVLAGLVKGDPEPRSRYRVVTSLIGRASWRKREVVTVEHDHDHSVGDHHRGDGALVLEAARGGTVVIRHAHTHRHFGWLPGTPAPFVVGMAHGFGAETPTQIALLATAAGSGALAAVLLGVAFVAGLMVANMIVAVVAALGATGAKHSRSLSRLLTAAAGLASIYVGVSALLG